MVDSTPKTQMNNEPTFNIVRIYLKGSLQDARSLTMW